MCHNNKSQSLASPRANTATLANILKREQMNKKISRQQKGLLYNKNVARSEPVSPLGGSTQASNFATSHRRFEGHATRQTIYQVAPKNTGSDSGQIVNLHVSKTFMENLNKLECRSRAQKRHYQLNARVKGRYSICREAWIVSA